MKEFMRKILEIELPNQFCACSHPPGMEMRAIDYIMIGKDEQLPLPVCQLCINSLLQDDGWYLFVCYYCGNAVWRWGENIDDFWKQSKVIVLPNCPDCDEILMEERK